MISTQETTPPPLARAPQARPQRSFVVLLCLMWLAAALSVPIRSHFEAPAWDVGIYLQAVHSVAIGHDPYADAIARQERHHAELALHPNDPTPFSYVYSPITLPIIRIVAVTPLWLSGVVYWTLYLAGLFAQIWVGLQAAEPNERRWLLLLTPAAAFFPGWLASDIVWSGNVAFILYGLALATAVLGWRRGRWLPFYVAVVIASCVKAPLLTLLAIPLFSARRQWLPAAGAAAVGLVLFFVQPLLWPTLFANYLKAVELQFSFNRDFGSSPAGLFSGVLFDHHLPYSPASLVFFLVYALPLAAVLLYLGNQCLRGRFPLRQWIPVLLVGVVLLNPRILEYDEILLALPLTLIAWRFFHAVLAARAALLATAILFATANSIAFQSWTIWKSTEGPLLVCLFSVGVWTLLRTHPLPQTTPAAA